MCNPDTPQEIAPHEGREIELVLDGTKPLASIQMNAVNVKVLNHRGMTMHIYNGNIYFALSIVPINVYKFLTNEGSKLIVKSQPEHNRLMGRLFGYTEDQIDVFIENKLECDCKDCRGNF